MLSRRIILVALSTIMLVAVAVPATAASPFLDVPDTNVFSADIEWLADQGITKGCNPPTNDLFCPTDNVTREQMAAFLVRALGLTDDGGGNTFTDDNGSIFEDDIAKLAAAGITKGCNPPFNTQFCPTDNVTREQMAAFLHRALDQPPTMVTGLIVTLSGGSSEIDVSWEPNPEADIDHYNVWFSQLPGETKTLVPEPYFFGPATKPSGRWFITDWPRDQTSGESCYQISAIDTAAQEGPRSVEDCFDSTPGTPGQVMNVTVGLGGGSGEVTVSWDSGPEADIHHYNVWFSELAGGTKTLVPEPYFFGPVLNAGRWSIVDDERDLTDGKTCYEISAVDFNDKEGEVSVEACFDHTA
ncbi:MAG: S-layer homology domain-containing protein [Actinomycetota bacterium]|nr:S-layer homology domain-containing protein [Actinomycetota bacterium]